MAIETTAWGAQFDREVFPFNLEGVIPVHCPTSSTSNVYGLLRITKDNVGEVALFIGNDGCLLRGEQGGDGVPVVMLYAGRHNLATTMFGVGDLLVRSEKLPSYIAGYSHHFAYEWINVDGTPLGEEQA